MSYVFCFEGKDKADNVSTIKKSAISFSNYIVAKMDITYFMLQT